MTPRCIALTQRVVTFPARNESGDYLDCRWAEMIEETGGTVVPLPNRTKSIEFIFREAPIDLLVLSGGNDLACLDGAVDAHGHRDGAELLAIRLAATRRIPVLGVCRGAQLLMANVGVQPVRLAGHAGTVHAVHTIGHPAWGGPHEFAVRSYHDWGIPNEGIPSFVEILAVADDCSVEAFHIPALDQWGLMWHPEREEAHGPGGRAFRSIVRSL